MWKGAAGIYWIEAKDTAKYPQMHGAAPLELSGPELIVLRLRNTAQLIRISFSFIIYSIAYLSKQATINIIYYMLHICIFPTV